VSDPNPAFEGVGDHSKVGVAQQREHSAGMRSRSPEEDGGVRCGACLKGAGEVLAMFEGPNASSATNA